MLGIIKRLFDNSKLYKLQNLLFDIMLTIEMVVVYLDKSDFHFAYESYVFRVTFLIACMIILAGIARSMGFISSDDKMSTIPQGGYDVREYILTAILMVVAVITYKMSGRNDMLRFLVFIAACKGLDITKKLRLFFYENLIGSSMLILLSVTGIYGRVMAEHSDGRMLYVFGFGNANAFHCMFMMILFLGLYVYSEKLKWYYYLAVFVLNFIVYRFTSCETAFALTALGIIGSCVIGNLNIRKHMLKDYIWVYIAGIVMHIFCIAFSVWSAIASKYSWSVWYIWDIDELLTGRIKNLYWNWDSHPGAIESWRLFAGPDTEYYFDMGWCRLAYWYGIIPAVCVIVLLLILYIDCMNKRDGYLLVMLTCLSIYTIVEAHLVSVYIGRNYILLFLGACVYSIFDKRDGEMKNEW